MFAYPSRFSNSELSRNEPLTSKHAQVTDFPATREKRIDYYAVCDEENRFKDPSNLGTTNYNKEKGVDHYISNMLQLASPNGLPRENKGAVRYISAGSVHIFFVSFLSGPPDKSDHFALRLRKT